MNIFFYSILFIIGSLFGSFYTLAIHRIPKRQDITHTHSYCPNCNHKLGLLDLFPIFSYLFLRGKCRYCKMKIRPRYFLLEILTGLTFLAIAYSMQLKVETLTQVQIIEYSFMALYITFIALLAGIDKENRKMEKSVLVYGIVVSILYMVYLCLLDPINIYRYGIYLILYLILLIFDTITLKRYAKNSYVLGILMMNVTMIMITGEFITGISIIFTLLAIASYMILAKLKEQRKRGKKTEKQIAKQISIGFYLGITNLVVLIVALLSNYSI